MKRSCRCYPYTITGYKNFTCECGQANEPDSSGKWAWCVQETVTEVGWQVLVKVNAHGSGLFLCRRLFISYRVLLRSVAVVRGFSFLAITI